MSLSNQHGDLATYGKCVRRQAKLSRSSRTKLVPLELCFRCSPPEIGGTLQDNFFEGCHFCSIRVLALAWRTAYHEPTMASTSRPDGANYSSPFLEEQESLCSSATFSLTNDYGSSFNF